MIFGRRSRAGDHEIRGQHEGQKQAEQRADAQRSQLHNGAGRNEFLGRRGERLHDIVGPVGVAEQGDPVRPDDVLDEFVERRRAALGHLRQIMRGIRADRVERRRKQ